MSLGRPWAYRPWKGFGVWLGASVVDFVAIPATSEAAGYLSLCGFVVALLWAIHGPQPEVTRR